MSEPRRSGIPAGGGSLESVFPGAGSVAARMRVLDWSQTTLGPPLSWPPTLRAAVALCLASPVPMAIWWGDELATFYNDAFVALLGAGPCPAVFGLQAKDAWPHVWTEVGPEIERVLATGQAGWLEEARVTLSRATPEEAVHVTLALSPLLSEQGEVGGVFCVGRERQTSLAPAGMPRESLATVRSSGQTPRFVMGVGELDGGRFVAAPPAQRSADSPAEPPSELGGSPIVGDSQAMALWVGACTRSRVEGTPVRFEYERASSSGNEWISVTVAFVGDLGGAARFAFLTEDLTARKRADEALRQADRNKGDILAMLGHELRNPLAPIATVLQVLRARDVDLPELAVIERQAEHLRRLVDDLLDISRIARGHVELHRERFEFRSAVARGVEMAMPMVSQRGHRLEMEASFVAMPIEGDRERLAQVVSNLIANAAKYSAPGTTIHVGAERTGAMIRLSVRDEGVGIPKEMLERVFDPFVQEPQALDRARGGLGLGLAIVRSLVQLHGGVVTARSQGPGRGSEFLVDLPLARGKEGAGPRRDSLAAAAAAMRTAVTGKNRVLVVDDNSDFVRASAQLLSLRGYDVAVAHDGPSALQTALRFRPHVCLLDVGLPLMDGYELARRLRELSGPASDLRLVAITGYGQETDRLRSAEAGFHAHLVKPISWEVLAKAMSFR